MKYYIIAGEASGDLHGSNLIKGLYANDPQAEIRFWGGDMMLEACNQVEGGPERDTDESKRSRSGLVRHYKEGAVMGITDVFRKAGRLIGNIKFCKKDIISWKPDVVILIDYPGFNFKIAEFAHKRGIRTYYYIAPKVWASREGRIKKLKAFVDRLYIIFPFEIPYFREKGVSAIYKGNPLVDEIAESRACKETRTEFLTRNGLEDKPIIALLAGSRKAEINTMMPVLMEFVKKMKGIPKYSEYQFIIAGAPARSPEDYIPFIDQANPDIHILFGETRSIVRQAEAAVVNSGTASLETVLLGTPQVVGYLSSPITYAVAKRVVKVKYISLGNLIIDRLAFRELIQNECNADALVEEVRRLTEDETYRAEMFKEYSAIREALGGRGASAAVARDMVEHL